MVAALLNLWGAPGGGYGMESVRNTLIQGRSILLNSWARGFASVVRARVRVARSYAGIESSRRRGGENGAGEGRDSSNPKVEKFSGTLWLRWAHRAGGVVQRGTRGLLLLDAEQPLHLPPANTCLPLACST
jgi:hypothetical protein